MKFLAPANRHLSTPPECRGSTSHEGVTPHTKAPLSSRHSSKPPDHKYHSLLFYLVAAGPKIHKQSSLHSTSPLMWLLTSNLTENRNLSCVSILTCGWHNKSYRKKKITIFLFHITLVTLRNVHCSYYWHKDVPKNLWSSYEEENMNTLYEHLSWHLSSGWQDVYQNPKCKLKKRP